MKPSQITYKQQIVREITPAEIYSARQLEEIDKLFKDYQSTHYKIIDFRPPTSDDIFIRCTAVISTNPEWNMKNMVMGPVHNGGLITPRFIVKKRSFKNYSFVFTGEVRVPKCGDWYFIEESPSPYCALSDHGDDAIPYPIYELKEIEAQ